MGKTKENERTQETPADDTKTGPDGTPSHPFTLESPEVSGPLARMVEATEAEAKARDSAEAAIAEAAGNAWGILRDATLELIAVAGFKVAGEALDAYKGKTTIIGGRTKARGNQYASDLRRAVKAAAAGKDLPEALRTAGRSAWNEHAFWTTSGVTVKRSTQAPDATTTEQAKADAEARTAAGPDGLPTTGSVHAGAVADAIAKAAEDAGWQELTTLYANLHGPFKAEAFAEVKATLERIAAKQHQAGTGTK
jgi:hypothetical protein